MHASRQWYSLVDERYLVICYKITSTKIYCRSLTSTNFIAEVVTSTNFIAEV